MKQKYIDERVGVWFVFGTHPDGTVDISDGNNLSLFTKIHPFVAKDMCDLQEKFREELYKII